MRDDFKISGSLIQAYYVCKRQVWLMSRKLEGMQDNDYLAIGRYLSKKTYQRERKELYINGNIIDVIKKEQGKLLLIETKKSSKMIQSAKMQLLFYMLTVEQFVEELKAQIRIPIEKKIINLEINDESRQELAEVLSDIEQIVGCAKPEQPVKKRYCKTCSYHDFCWS